MAEDVDKVERARLAREEIIDHMDCDDCTEDYVFLLKQGGREFGMGLTTVLSMLAFAEHEARCHPPTGMVGTGIEQILMEIQWNTPYDEDRYRFICRRFPWTYSRLMWVKARRS